MKKRYRSHLIVITLYTLLTLLLTWPLAGHLTSHIPGEATWAFDESTFVWNMWWLKYSVLTLGQTPLYSDYTFYPLGIDLTTYTFNLFHAAFGLPLQLALSLPLANNLTLFFSYIVSAYGTFLLTLYLLHRRPDQPGGTAYHAAFLAGAVFAFSASRMMYVALGHYNFVTIQWFPFYTLFLLKALHTGQSRASLMAGLFAALCLYVELTYSVFLLFLTLFIVISNRKSWPQQIRPLVTLAGVALLLTGPFVLAVLPDFLDPAFAEPGWGEGLKLSADLAGLVTLTPLHPLSGLDWVTELRNVITGHSRFSDANTLFLGYGVLALALLGVLVRPKAGRVWLWSALIFAVLSLGPLLTLNGQNRFDLDGLEVTFPLPFALLHYLPIINANRVPNRFGIPLTLALAILVGYAAAWLLNKVVVSHFTSVTLRVHVLSMALNLPLLLATALLLLVLLADQISVPLSLSEARIPAVYEQIGAEPGEFTVMQLPLGWRNSYGTLGAERTQLQYFQTVHHRPMLGGNTSRNPAFKFDYYRHIPLFQAITETELYDTPAETTLDQARRQAAELMTLYNIKYLVIHEPIPQRFPYVDTALATRSLTLDLIPHQPEPVYQGPGVQAFAVRQAPIPEPLTLNFGTWSSTPYRGAGWAGDETIFAATANWVTAEEAVIFFPVRHEAQPDERRLAVQIAPFSYPGMPEQSLSLSLNGHNLSDKYLLRQEWQAVEAVLPAEYLSEGLNRLTLRFAHTAQPRQVLPANRAIGSTGLDTPVDLEVNSGADFAFVTVGFGAAAQDASAHRRGLNLTIIEPQTGRVLAVQGFDTAANEFEAAALADFIAAIPAGQIVIVVSQGPEATAFLTAEALAALQELGLNSEGLSPPFSAIGVKGAAGGSAAQAKATNESSAYLRLGAMPDDRALAAAVDSVTIAKP